MSILDPPQFMAPDLRRAIRSRMTLNSRRGLTTAIPTTPESKPTIGLSPRMSTLQACFEGGNKAPIQRNMTKSGPNRLARQETFLDELVYFGCLGVLCVMNDQYFGPKVKCLDSLRKHPLLGRALR
jgi:hypothetical protein